MKQVNLCDWTELLSYASANGWDWNTAHDALVSAGVVPMCSDMPTTTIYLGVCEDYGWTGIAKEIVDGFLVQQGVDSITLTM